MGRSRPASGSRRTALPRPPPSVRRAAPRSPLNPTRTGTRATAALLAPLTAAGIARSTNSASAVVEQAVSDPQVVRRELIELSPDASGDVGHQGATGSVISGHPERRGGARASQHPRDASTLDYTATRRPEPRRAAHRFALVRGRHLGRHQVLRRSVRHVDRIDQLQGCPPRRPPRGRQHGRYQLQVSGQDEVGQRILDVALDGSPQRAEPPWSGRSPSRPSSPWPPRSARSRPRAPSSARAAASSAGRRCS